MDPTNTPALPPPPGVKSNFVDPVTLQSQRIVVSTVGISISTLCVATRLYVRFKIKKFNLEDYVLLLSWGSFMAFEALIIAAGQYGDGTHQWDVTALKMSKTLQVENIAELLYCVVMFTIKYVVLYQIRAIFFSHNRGSFYCKVISGLIWVNLLLYTGFFFSFIFACIPREKIWRPTVQGRCINTPVAIAACAALNLVSDLAILVTPIIVVWKLQIPVTKKVGASAVFAVGVFAIVAGIMRLYSGLKMFWTDDLTWAISPVGQWTTAEFTTGFLVACLPYFPRLLDRFCGRGTAASKYHSDVSMKQVSHKVWSRDRTVHNYSEISSMPKNKTGTTTSDLPHDQFDGLPQNNSKAMEMAMFAGPTKTHGGIQVSRGWEVHGA
ncbi:hypothetical protein F4818DRAFT_420727 [Hypoxylon cercidicola]|nr:hypothetical protein F4818DRAFT_420727 [Hypoxylon cercidicola]